MSKTLKLDGDTAKRLYPTASAEFKELLEQNFTKEFFKPVPITELIQDYSDVCEKLGVDDSDESMIIQIPGFDKGQTDMLRAIAKKMRVVEVYNGKKQAQRSDKRYYNWYRFRVPGPGLVFRDSGYSVVHAGTSSAARLAFLSEEHLRDARKKFHYLDEQIIEL